MSRIYPLTDRQREVLEAVRTLSENGRGPSLEEIGERVGMASTWAVRRHLGILERKGFLKPRGFNNPRGIALAEPIAAAA